MSSIPQNREWMKAPRASPHFLDGVISFLEFAQKNPRNDGWYCCPCVKCCNVNGKKTLSVVRDHLICEGIDPTYTTWYFHGETLPSGSLNTEVPTESSSADPKMIDLVNDALKHVCPEFLDACMDDVRVEGDSQDEDDLPNDDLSYKTMKEDAVRPVYPSCKDGQTKLSVTIELMSMKARHQMSDNCFTEMLEIFKSILPEGNTLPENTYNAKTMIKSLGMDYISIDACRNDCILYWKEHATREKCPTCKESRWKSKHYRGTKVPWKVLRYFPITPRLRRMYSIPWIAENMVWHANSVGHDDYMRHPCDSSSWKSLDRKFPEFSTDPRNVRLGLATDGFNPFGDMSSAYSCWPVMMVPYNLPPSYCMRKEFTMLTLLIPGKKGPGRDIDVYLQPLVDELKELWGVGSIAYDAYTKKKFTMKAALLWAIHDFPAYGSVSGCRTSGKFACPICSEATGSIRLKHGKKTVYMTARTFLATNHIFRSQKAQFNGEEEHRKNPKRMGGSEVLRKVETFQTIFGKCRKRKRAEDQENATSAWSKRSILFDLPYWEKLHIRHNLDVMHVEKNVAENLLATMMDTKGKTKDGLAARKDLKELKIRKKLWPVEKNGKCFLPKAPFALSRSEKEVMCKTLYDLKVPIGYSSNWKHHVDMEDFQLKTLKSHDYHIIMQSFFPIMLMHAFKKEKPLRAAIMQLSSFFNALCAKVINRPLLLAMKEHAVEILCVFEKYFPPSFFVSMVHLVLHLADEALIAGPVWFRWMYPFERIMRTYKMYVKNKTYPEGCIAERYLIVEAMRYCMEYMPDGRKGNHKRKLEKLVDGNPIDKKGKHYTLSHLQYEQVRIWLLRQSPDNAQWEVNYQLYLKSPMFRGQSRRSNRATERPLAYIPWLREQLENTEMTIFKRLVNGPSFEAISYKAYAQNGYIFCTSESELNKTTQNSGVSMQALTPFRSSSKDANVVEGLATYYGIIRNIFELDYFDFKETVFYCDWVRIEDRVNGYVVDPETGLIFVNFGRFKSRSRESDEPFIRSFEASQVFYCKDPTRDNWHVVMESPKKVTRDVDLYEDPLVVEARMQDDLLASLVNDVVEEHLDNTEGSWV